MPAAVRPGAAPGSRRHAVRAAYANAFPSPDRLPFMKLRPLLVRSARLALVAIAAGFVLSGCAAAQPDGPGDCVGPPDFCVPFFGS
ncbi:hypothetical protein [Burkholderia vietnamiensis]|nr:hypothetical protein [Burkholderia vietnamiensis]MBR8284780.1 hypothetical protein [Burkholderia vietnamiensis]MCA8016552.1 hypothetical protein [Burkholderia vietnamiensis]MDN8070256.1 hypothetical protein [Burkholderia vietnamiensis]HDR8941863.1 hypothetical protein [Burkholderia vietnamiensis]HDR9265971.1 hypothetical protein [Burkholderia vietnamiensis]